MRAGQNMSLVQWRPWSDASFEDARDQDKPVLLSIVAKWCQFCAQLDSDVYANEAIASYINENYIPVRVDSDVRPEINARYTQGGWPSTCILTGEGDLLWGGNALPREHMAQLLPQVLGQYRGDKNALNAHITQLRLQVRQQNTPPAFDPSAPLQPQLPLHILMASKFEFDFAFGGFGHSGQKFPHVDVLALVADALVRSYREGAGDPDLRFMLDRTLMSLTRGELHDSVNHGFFRYCQTADWRNPMIEKLLDDNASIARTAARVYQATGDSAWLDVATDTLGYLDTQLAIDGAGYGSSQYADGEYYSQPEEERREWNSPAIDETFVSGANAQAARAWYSYWQATGDAAALDKAVAIMDRVANLVAEDGCPRHSEADGSSEGLLVDAARVLAASVDLYEAGVGDKWLMLAELVAVWMQNRLVDRAGGAFHDHPVREDALGHLKFGTKDLPDNMIAADAFLRLFLATGEDEYRTTGTQNITALQVAAPQMGFLAAGLALASIRALAMPVIVHIVGSPDDKRTKDLVAAAHRPARLERFVQVLDPTNEADREHIDNLEYEVTDIPTAYPRIGENPLAPTIDAETLRETVDQASIA